MSLSKEIAANLLKIKAVSLSPNAPFTWASGIQSPIYTDNRVTLAYPEVRSQIEEGFTALIKAEFPEVEVIAGTATAGIPHGAIIADYMKLPFAYIRSKPKDHGAGNQVEGRVTKGQKMVVVEDLISTGGSVLDAVAAAEREGAEVLGVVAIFTYELEKANAKFAAAGVTLKTLSNYSDLIENAQETGYVTADELALLKKFKVNQKTWQN
jgi:orotate phosphoribosyltransferase